MSKPQFNQAEFDRLPMLLTRKTVMAWTGLGSVELSEAARKAEVRTHPAYGTKGKKCKFFKADVARICGLKG